MLSITYVGIRFDVASGATSSAWLSYVRTGNNAGAFQFKARNAARRLSRSGTYSFFWWYNFQRRHGLLQTLSTIMKREQLLGDYKEVMPLDQVLITVTRVLDILKLVTEFMSGYFILQTLETALVLM